MFHKCVRLDTIIITKNRYANSLGDFCAICLINKRTEKRKTDQQRPVYKQGIKLAKI